MLIKLLPVCNSCRTRGEHVNTAVTAALKAGYRGIDTADVYREGNFSLFFTFNYNLF